MLRNQSFTRTWGKDEKRENRIIFIGRGMAARRKELTEGFMECLAQPLRFPIGTKVFANVDQGYAPATIIGHWDDCRAYRIRLEDGDEVWAPLDDDRFVKAAKSGKGKGY